MCKSEGLGLVQGTKDENKAFFVGDRLLENSHPHAAIYMGNRARLGVALFVSLLLHIWAVHVLTVFLKSAEPRGTYSHTGLSTTLSVELVASELGSNPSKAVIKDSPSLVNGETLSANPIAQSNNQALQKTEFFSDSDPSASNEVLVDRSDIRKSETVVSELFAENRIGALMSQQKRAAIQDGSLAPNAGQAMAHTLSDDQLSGRQSDRRSQPGQSLIDSADGSIVSYQHPNGSTLVVHGGKCYQLPRAADAHDPKVWPLASQCPWTKNESERFADAINRYMQERYPN